MFRADVAAHMPVDASAPETWGDGQVFLASRAHELGRTQEAMSSLSIAVAGVLTAVLCPFFVSFIQ